METNNEERYRPLAVITGASSGIGYELAKVFTQNGFDILITAEDLGIESAAESLSDGPAEVEYIRLDLARRDGVEKLHQKIKSMNRPVEAVCINAGVGVSGPFLETDLEREINMINLNVTSTVALAKYMVQEMALSGGGRILFTSSVAGDLPGPFLAVYAATKAFVQFFAEGIREELKDKGIVVTALQPGPTETNFFERADMLDTKAGKSKKDDPAKVAQDGFDALMAGKDHVVAGSFKNKIQVAVSKLMSEAQNAKMHRKQTEPQPGRH